MTTAIRPTPPDPLREPPADTGTPAPPSVPYRRDLPARVRRLVRGPAADPVWVRPAAAALLVATGVLYLVGLGASGWANAFYAAAAQAGASGGKAMFFGSFDPANFITVDKTPAALWVTGLSVRLFGLSSWSILVPQALEGVAAVALLYATVRRWSGAAAGVLAGAVLATTPVAVLMFRFNNPDALLVLLLVAGAYGVVRAIERAGTGWLLFAGVCVGFGFLTKMLQAFLVVPAFALVYLVAAPAGLGRRLWQLVAAGGAVVVSAGWWVAIVELWPAESRPYIGGSQHNSILELTLGYNGFGRLTGDETGSVGGGRGWGTTGWTRLLSGEIGGQAGWLLPAAAVLLAAGLWLTRRAPRTDRLRAALLLWGGWLVVTAGVFSVMRGIFHAYYTVALAPAIAALIGTGTAALWRRRDRLAATGTLAACCAGTAAWSYVLLDRSPTWYPWLRVAVLVTGLAAAGMLLVANRLPRVAAAGVAGAALVAGLAGPVGYAVQTASVAHTGAIPAAGPATLGGGPGGFGGPGGPGGFAVPGAGGRGQGGRFGAGGIGGLLRGSTPTPALVALLRTDSASYPWAAAVVGANNAAGYQLATGSPVMAIGGFNGSDPAPTLAQFQRYVDQKKVHYFVGGAPMPSDSGSDAAQQVADWVAGHFTAVTVGGTTVYDLTKPSGGN
ncbi:ArnT family glycosyltransferase [Planosporangium sp. 12N6]|uniref:ArnT family glycosyltransferase n=1 Tax=Planosporangium spinosum TaxID=3402278 RepID=UPI003CF7B3AE